jgi:hypothetical protein
MYFPFAVILVAELLMVLAFSLDFVSLEGMYNFAIACLTLSLALSYRGLFPFGPDRKITNKIAWIAIAIIPIMSISSVANFDIILFWYPTNHRIWALFPLSILGFISYRYKLIV